MTQIDPNGAQIDPNGNPDGNKWTQMETQMDPNRN